MEARALRVALLFLPLLAAVILTACGESRNPLADGRPASTAAQVPTAATLGAQQAATTAEYLAQEPYASAKHDNGARLAQMCRACHTFGAGEAVLVGPNLHRIFGREAGSGTGFDYSEVLGSADFVWTPAALDAWLAQPARFLPGNRMTFAGVPDAGDRADLIAYLLAATAAEN